MSNELLEKVISTTTLGANGADGLLRPEQADRFIDYMFDASVLGNQVEQVRMRGNEQEISVVGVGEHLMRMATEATADHVVPEVVFSKVSLKNHKLRMDWELSTESLEDGIEGEALDDHIARLMSTQAANDLEDLAINGNVDTGHWLMGAFDGWRKRLYAGGHVIDAAGASIEKGILNKALRTMPRRHMADRRNLKWFSNVGVIQDYLYDALLVEAGWNSTANTGANRFQRPQSAYDAANNSTNVAPAAPGWTPASPFGIPLQEVYLFPEYDVSASAGQQLGTDVWLVDAKNLVWGVKRAIKVYREFAVKKDSIEYTLFTRVGAAVKNPDASVVIKNVGYKA